MAIGKLGRLVSLHRARLLGLALGLSLASPDPAPAVAKPAKAATEPARGAAKRELEAFERKLKPTTDTDVPQVLEGAERRLKVVEVTTTDDFKGWAELEENRRLLGEAKALLLLAKLPKGKAKPAPKEALAALQKRYDATYEAALLQEVDYLQTWNFGFVEVPLVPALLDEVPGARVAMAKKNLSEVKSPAGKARAKVAAEALKNQPALLYTSLGSTTFDSLGIGLAEGEVVATCKKTSKDDLAWQLLEQQAAVQVAMAKGAAVSVLASGMPHHDGPNPAEDMKQALFGRVIDVATRIEQAKGCTERSRSPSAPPGTGEAVRTILKLGIPVEAARLELTNTGAEYNPLYEGPQLQANIKARRAELDKAAKDGTAALARYKKARTSTKPASANPTDLVTARDQLRSAQTAGNALLKERAALRKHEDDAIDFIVTRDKPLEGAKQGLASAREANQKLTVLLAQLTKDAGKDPQKLADAKGANLVGKRAKDTLSYVEAQLTKTRGALQKSLARTKLGTVAAYPQRVAQAAKEDAALSARLATIADQLKEVESLRAAGGNRCDLASVDWKNFSYSFGKMKKGRTEDCEVMQPEASGYEYGINDPRSFLSAAYADFDGDGTLEALVTILDESCGAMSVDQHDVLLFGAGPGCAPTELDLVTMEACGTKKLNGIALQIDRKECFEPPTQEQWTVVKGKLQKKGKGS